MLGAAGSQVIYPNVLMSINSFDHADLAAVAVRAYTSG
jgi:hypothetical protein